MSKLKLRPDTIWPTAEEDVAITDATLRDPDTLLLDGDNIKLVPFKTHGRPYKAVVKKQVSIRYSPEVIEAFQATGQGWQSRMDFAIKDWLKTHSPNDIKA